MHAYAWLTYYYCYLLYNMPMLCSLHFKLRVMNPSFNCSMEVWPVTAYFAIETKAKRRKSWLPDSVLMWQPWLEDLRFLSKNNV